MNLKLRAGHLIQMQREFRNGRLFGDSGPGLLHNDTTGLPLPGNNHFAPGKRATGENQSHQQQELHVMAR